MDIAVTLIMLLLVLLIGDVIVTLWYKGIDEFLAPIYVHRIPGGAVYWFLVKGGQ